MPNVLHADETIETQLANALRRIRQLEKRSSGGGFDPNETPVIIGQNATAGATFTPSSPAGGALKAVVIGWSADATASYAVAIGGGFSNGAQASGDSSVAVGRDASASATGAVAIGYGASSSGTSNSSVAVGTGSTASSEGSVALGDSAWAHNFFATALGADSNAGGDNGTAVGTSTSATGTNSTAVGTSTQAHNSGSTALGAAAHANHDHATAIGAGAIAGQDNQIMLGTTADFVEIPGAGSANGLVLAEQGTGTRFIVQVVSGALALSAAP
jgi:autotransporter adhesin